MSDYFNTVPFNVTAADTSLTHEQSPGTNILVHLLTFPFHSKTIIIIIITIVIIIMIHYNPNSSLFCSIGRNIPRVIFVFVQ